jgi:hypothetical protein
VKNEIQRLNNIQNTEKLDETTQYQNTDDQSADNKMRP